jgi:lysophospholipase L1-like esterase
MAFGVFREKHDSSHGNEMLKFLFQRTVMFRAALIRASFGLVLTSAALLPAQAPQRKPWVATWSAAPDSPGPVFKDQTLRQILRVSVGGTSMRVRLSNLFGTGPITLGPARVARHGAGSAIQAGSDHALTFMGKTTVTIPKGESVWSDAVAIEVAPLQEWAVSLYVPAGGGPSTIHTTGMQTMYITKSGDATAAITLSSADTDDSRYFLTDVEVTSHVEPRALVAMGDSITDGVGSKDDQNARWPDALAARLQREPALAGIAVVNAGISGNRILNDGRDPFLGPSGLSRAERDVFGKPGVRWVVLLEGINDITASGMFTDPKEQVTAPQIIEGMKTLIARAHAKGLKIFGATLLPRGGATGPRGHTPSGEAKRLAVNAWIRSSGAFDAVLDFEKVLQDPAHPDQLLPAYDSGDHTHPNNAGYQAMANAFDLRLLR